MGRVWIARDFTPFWSSTGGQPDCAWCLLQLKRRNKAPRLLFNATHFSLKGGMIPLETDAWNYNTIWCKPTRKETFNILGLTNRLQRWGRERNTVMETISEDFYFVTVDSGIKRDRPHNTPIAVQYLENISPINIEYAVFPGGGKKTASSLPNNSSS